MSVGAAAGAFLVGAVALSGCQTLSVLSVSDGGMVTLFDGFQASGRA